MNRLFVNKITSVGAVESGDNEPSKIMFWKRRVKKRDLTEQVRDIEAAWRADHPFTQGQPDSWVKSVHDTFVIVEEGEKDWRIPFTQTDSEVTFGVREQVKITETIATVKSWLHSITGTDSAPTKRTGMDLAKLGLTVEVRKEIEDSIAADKATIADRDAEIAKLSEKPVDVLKGISDEAKAEFEKQNAEIVKMQKAADAQAEALTKERDARLLAEFTKTAEGYTSVLGKADEAGPMLKALASDDKAFEWLTKKLDAVGAIVKASDLFKELGVTDEGDPKAQIEALAKEKQKDNPKLTSAQAKVLVRKERPDLKAAERETV